MANITIRNIPDDLFSIIKTLSSLERRSINNEILTVLEKGLTSAIGSYKNNKEIISKDTQIMIWKDLSGKWKDDRSTEQIKKDILANRTLGREVIL